jgi:hypothetical protein
MPVFLSLKIFLFFVPYIFLPFVPSPLTPAGALPSVRYAEGRVINLFSYACSEGVSQYAAGACSHSGMLNPVGS